MDSGGLILINHRHQSRNPIYCKLIQIKLLSLHQNLDFANLD